MPGHAKVCKGKQLYSIVMVETNGKEEMTLIEDDANTNDGEYHDAETIPKVQLSMHALTGTSSLARTFTLTVKIGNTSAVALVDSGSDVSFINAKFALKHNLSITQIDPVKVAAANGTEMLSSTACTACPYSIQDHQFSSDLRLLEVQGFDVVLGAEWIYTHSPVGLDLKKREFSITKDGKELITFKEEICY